uniref:Uncharacterized protein n=1 Tax=Candidatus Methanophaga sp. ANME-1 ERB7 TaxID=2759913 RepID=A0A7G9Z5L8_9EURY|nr:hypothetical protein KJBBJMEN_00001 [Methanosarcinales archaeon ANME-1 ERB7]
MEGDLLGLLTNTATASSTDSLGNTVTCADDASVDLTSTSECTVTKTPSVNTATVGETITYSFTVMNSGDTTLSSLTLTDSMLGPITLDKTTLAPGEVASSTGGPYTHTVVEGDLPGPLTNTATASSTDSLGNTVTCADDASVDLTSTSECTVTKTPSVNTATVGETITYSFTVMNTGDTTLSSLTLTDSMLGPITLDKTTLAPLETASSTGGPYAHTVVEGDLPGPLTNTATASSTDSLGNTVTCADDASVDLTSTSECTVTKTPSVNTATVGETITYSFTVMNTGDTTLSSLTLTDSMLGPITLDKTTLAPGDVASSTGGPYAHTVVEGDLPGPLTNTATASSTDSQGNPVTCADDASVDLTSTSEITIKKTASLTGSCPGSDPLAVSIGDTVTYCFNVTNTGDVTLTNVAVSDNVYGPVTNLDKTTLAPGESAHGTVTHIVVASDPSSITNTATANGTNPCGGTVNDTDDCTIIVNIHPDVELEKSGSPAIVAPGGNVTYTINYTNTGAVPLHHVVITEHYPKGVTFISASPAPDAGTTNVWTIGTLLPGKSGTIVIKVKVPEPIDLSFTETGSVIGEGLVRGHQRPIHRAKAIFA